MKKRIAAAVLCFVLTALLCSCGKYAGVTVNSQKIGKGVYAWFCDRARAENPDADENTRTAAADRMLRRYVAVNSEFAARSLSVSPADRKTLTETVDSCWHLYSAYYTSLGISRQDIYNIELNKVYEKTLMLSYYSADGEKPLSESELKQYFSDNFVALRTVTGFLTTVDDNNNAVSMSGEQKQAMIDTFNGVAQDINENSSSLIDASSQLQNVSVTEDMVVISADNSYPDGFYEKIRELENGKAAAFVIGDYIFCAQRYEILSDGYGLFSKYNADCLKALKGEEFDSVIDSWAENYSVEH